MFPPLSDDDEDIDDNDDITLIPLGFEIAAEDEDRYAEELAEATRLSLKGSAAGYATKP